MLDDLKSHDIHVYIVTKSKLSDPQVFFPLLKGYEKFIPLGHRGSDGVVVLLREDSSLQVHPVLLDPEDVMHTSKQSFRVVAVYEPLSSEWADFFKNLERFLVTSKTLVLLGDLNSRGCTDQVRWLGR